LIFVSLVLYLCLLHCIYILVFLGRNNKGIVYLLKCTDVLLLGSIISVHFQFIFKYIR